MNKNEEKFLLAHVLDKMKSYLRRLAKRRKKNARQL